MPGAECYAGGRPQEAAGGRGEPKDLQGRVQVRERRGDPERLAECVARKLPWRRVPEFTPTLSLDRAQGPTAAKDPEALYPKS